jgi:hypothetical protein
VARERPTASTVIPPIQTLRNADDGEPLGLTRAEAHALLRCAPLTPTQFKALGRLAEQGVNPLRHL